MLIRIFRFICLDYEILKNCPKMTNLLYIIIYPFYYTKDPILGQLFGISDLKFYHYFEPLFLQLYFFH